MINENKSWAGFAHATYDLTDRFAVTAGIRYSWEEKHLFQFTTDDNTGEVLPQAPGVDRDETGTWSSWSPKLGVEFRLNENVLLYSNVSRGFKSGGFNGRSGANPVFDRFDPEILWTLEAGIKSDWMDRRLRLNGAAFYSDYEGIQFSAGTEDPDGNRINAFTNAGDGEIIGFELEAVALPTNNLELAAGIGFIDADYTKITEQLNATVLQITLDSKFPKTSTWNVNLAGTYSVRVGNVGSLIARLDYLYISKYYNDITNVEVIATQDHDKINARLTYANTSGNWEIAAFVTNLFDEIVIETGFDTGSFFGISEATPQRPREWGVTTTFRF